MTKIAVIQTNWPGDRNMMIETYDALLAEAAGNGAQLACLQEFTLSPYFASVIDAENYKWAEPLVGGETDKIMGEIGRAHV